MLSYYITNAILHDCFFYLKVFLVITAFYYIYLNNLIISNAPIKWTFKNIKDDDDNKLMVGEDVDICWIFGLVDLDLNRKFIKHHIADYA